MFMEFKDCSVRIDNINYIEKYDVNVYRTETTEVGRLWRTIKHEYKVLDGYKYCIIFYFKGSDSGRIVEFDSESDRNVNFQLISNK